MASAFAHVIVPAVLCLAVKNPKFNWRLFVLAALVAIVPDADVMAFNFGIPYESQWGHRGFTHSIVFSLLIALVCSGFYSALSSSAITVFIVCFLACLSHSLLDAITNGGLGVALFWPVDEQRFFFSFRPIQVSPIGVKAFFTDRGLQVLKSEFIWVFLPSIAVAVSLMLLRKLGSKT